MKRILFLSIVVLFGYNYQVVSMDNIAYKQIQQIERDVEPLLEGAKGQSAKEAAMVAQSAVQSYNDMQMWAMAPRRTNGMREALAKAQEARNQAMEFAGRFDGGDRTVIFVQPTTIQKRNFDLVAQQARVAAKSILDSMQAYIHDENVLVQRAAQKTIDKANDILQKIGQLYSAKEIEAVTQGLDVAWIPELRQSAGAITQYKNAKNKVEAIVQYAHQYLLDESKGKAVKDLAQRLIDHSKNAQRIFSFEIGSSDSYVKIDRFIRELENFMRHIRTAANEPKGR